MTKATVIAPNGLSLRTAPSATSTKLRTLTFGTEVEIDGDAGGGWTKLVSPPGFVCNTCAQAPGGPWLRPEMTSPEMMPALPAGTALPTAPVLTPTLGPSPSTSASQVAMAVTTPTSTSMPPTGVLVSVKERLMALPKPVLIGGGLAIVLGLGLVATSFGGSKGS